jgi:lipopolysaccharide export system protein LptA
MKLWLSSVILALLFSHSATVFANAEEPLPNQSVDTLRVEADSLRSDIFSDGSRVVFAEGNVKLLSGSTVLVTDAARVDVDRDGRWVVTADSLRRLR